MLLHILIYCMCILKVKDLTALCQLPRLHTLNIAHCDCGGVVGSLSGCGQLKSLSLSGISIQSYELQQIKSTLQCHIQYDVL